MGFTAIARELCRHLTADGTVAAAELQEVFGPALRAAVVAGPCRGRNQAELVQLLLQLGADPLWRPAAGRSTVFDLAAVLASSAAIKSFLQHSGKQVLTTAVMLDAAVQAHAFVNPARHSSPSSVQRDKALILVQAAIGCSDSASVYAALQPGTAASSPVGDYDGAESLWPCLQGHFAQVMFSMCRYMEAELGRLSEQQPVVQQMYVQVAHSIDVR